MVAYGFKKQFIEPILSGLGNYEWIDGNIPRPKRQTIRAIGKRRHARPGEVIQLYTAMRTKQCRKLGEGRCKSVEPIRISVHNSGRVEIDTDAPSTRIITGAPLDEFARDDGFADWAAMRAFWLENHRDIVQLGPFVGVLIKWEGANG